MQYTTVKIADFGWVAVLGSENGILRLTLPQPVEEAALAMLGSLDGASRLPSRFEDLSRRLEAYFRGEQVEFPDALDLSMVAPFRRVVLHETRLIPYGETRSYGWLASRVGNPRASRAVGQAMATNPIPIIVPCHRVVGSDGGLTGFGGGLALKKRLLSLETAGRS